MEVLQVAVCLSLLFASVLAGSAPDITYDDGNDPIEVEVGAKNVEVTMTRYTDDETYEVAEILIQNPVTQEERLLARLNRSAVMETVTGYSVSISIDASRNAITMTLTIDSISAEDDGTLIARVISPDDVIDTKRNLTVIAKLSALHLKFDDREPISTKPEDPVEVSPGTYPVKCMAEGSNPPATDVKLHLDGVAVALQGELQTEMMAGDLRRYQTTVMGNVSLPEMKATVELECVAMDRSGDTLSTKLAVMVMVPEVEDVLCEETEAKEGDMSVSLVCTVDHASMNVSEFAFEVGNTGEVIRPGSSQDNETSVMVDSLSATKTKVTLTLPKVKDWHFESVFYLVISLADGQVRKETLRLKNSDGNAGNCPTSHVAWTLFFSAVVILRNRH